MIMPIKRVQSRYAPRGSFAAHVLTLMTGTSIAQAIPIAIAPILSRLYTPKEFGIFALFTSVVSIPAIVVTGRYELAIMLPENDEDSINLLFLAMIISMSVSMLTLLAILIYNDQIASFLGNQEIKPWLYWVPLSVLFSGIYQSLNYWSSRKKLYGKLAVSRVYQSASAAGSNLLLGFGGFGVSGLIGGNIIGQGVGTGILARHSWDEYQANKKHLSLQRIRDNAVRYRDFPFINSLHAVMDSLQTSGVAFVISIFFGSIALGLYAMSLNVLRAPLSLIGASAGQVFYQKASETCHNDGSLFHLAKSTIVKLSLAAFPFFVAFYMLAPELFNLIFGKNWLDAGKIAQIMSPWLFMNFITSPVSQIPILLHKQRTAFLIGILYNLAIFCPLLVVAYMGKGIILGLYLISFLASTVSIGYIIWILKLSKCKSEMASYYA